MKRLGAAMVRRYSPFWLLQAAGWSAYVVVMVLSRVGALPLSYLIANKGTLAVLGVPCTLVLRALLHRLRSRRASVAVTVVSVVAACGILSLGWMAAANVASVYQVRWLLDRPASIRSVWHLFDGAVYHGWVLLAWALAWFAAKQLIDLQEQRERALRAEALAHSSRLRALRYQLNPHFLFNTLNAVSTLIVDQRPSEANRMLARLADLLRLTMEEHATGMVTLDEELSLVLGYLEIERVRFGDRLEVQIIADAEARRAEMPAMLLQPLVENAIRHAVSRSVRGGRVSLVARRVLNADEGSSLRVTLRDDGPGPTEPAPAGHGIGLANVRERLAVLYPGQHRFEMLTRAEGGTEVVIELPYREIGSSAGALAAPAAGDGKRDGPPVASLP